MPTAVIATDSSTPKATPWMANIFALGISLAPMAVAIKAVVPVEMPEPNEMMMKNTGNERDSAARAWVEMRPAK